MTCHSFNTDEAEKYGVDAAIIIYNIRFWLNHNKANRTHINDGYVWTYNSARAFAELFPYWSSNKIQKLLRKLEKDGVIITGNYNKAKYDKTKWYSLPEFFVGSELDPSAKRLNGSSEKAEPIPDINTDVINKRADISKTDGQLFYLEDIYHEHGLTYCKQAIETLHIINLNGHARESCTGRLTMREWHNCEDAMRSIDEFDMEYFKWWMETRSSSLKKKPSLPNMLCDMNGITFEQFYDSTFMQEWD